MGNFYVGSYLEMHTTILGWMLYDNMADIIYVTGLWTIPFIWIVLKGWIESVTNTDDRPAPALSLRRVGYQLFESAFWFLLTFMPAMAVLPAEMKFTPKPTFTDLNPGTVTGASDPTTYADTFAQVTRSGGAQAPAWWVLVMKVSGGINKAVIDSLPKTPDIRSAQQQLSIANIPDPALAAEVQRFYSECYLPARNKYAEFTTSRDLAQSSIATTTPLLLAKYGVQDLEWMGSRILIETPGLYLPCPAPDACGESLQAQRPVSGWYYDPTRDTYAEPDILAGTPGKPYCNEWWNDGAVGIQNKILALDTKQDGFWSNMPGFVKSLAGWTQQEQTDARVRNILNNAGAESNRLTSAGALPYQYAQEGTVGGLLSTLASGAGTAVFYTLFSVTVKGIIASLPIIQALLVMMLYAFLPWFLLFSGYTTVGMVTATLVMFTFWFLHAIWSIAFWADQMAIQSIFGDSSQSMWSYLSSGDFWKTGGANLTQRMLVDIATMSLYLGMPVFWFSLMGWAGVHSAMAIRAATDSLAGSGTPTSQAASTGGRIASGPISSGVSKVPGGSSIGRKI